MLDANPDNVKELRATLDELKVLAAAQETCEFDPSGTSGRPLREEDGAATEPSVYSSRQTLRSLETNITNLESDFSSLSMEQHDTFNKGNQQGVNFKPAMGNTESSNVGAFSGIDLEGKKEYLQEMFPSIAAYTISRTLTKCNNDIDRSMDVLLNLAFFENNGNDENDNCDAECEPIFIPKGVEAFGEGCSYKKGRKKGKGIAKKSKTKQLLGRSMSACAENDLDTSKQDNKWDNGKKDVDFICSRTHLSAKTVSSAYHLNGAHLPSTIHYLARKEVENRTESTVMEDPVTVQQIAELHEDFSAVSVMKLAGLLQLARNSISAANELARVMVTKPDIPLINITTTNVARRGSIDSDYAQARRTKATSSGVRTPCSGKSLTGGRTLVDYHRHAGETAFHKAQAAYRRGKSDHLMGAAAGYYSAIGREHIEIAKRETSAAADALVDSQSTSKVLDLHGVSVQDGVRISCERVEQWWESLGDAKYAPGGGGPVREGYRIITGVGRHSKNGTARLGPAVARRLANEGWRVEVGQGHLTVTGMARHR